MYGNGHTFPVTGISLNLWEVTETWDPPESYSFSFTAGIVIRSNKKIPVFWVPYLNLLVKHITLLRFSGKKYNFMHFERQNAFQNA